MFKRELSENLRQLYNRLAAVGYAVEKPDHWMQFQETQGVGVYSNKEKEDHYWVRVEHNDAAHREAVTKDLEALFDDLDYVDVKKPVGHIKIGPR
jgi:hypothetical protein